MTDLSLLEIQRLETLAALQSWSPTRLAFKTSPLEWSTLQVLDHLVRSETGIHVQIRSNLNQPHVIGIRDRLGVRFIDRVFRSERRVKVPASAQAILPSSNLILREVQHRWENTRADLAELLAEVGPCSLGVFRHPVAGWMTMQQVLNFFEVHVIHHSFQLRRLARASSSLTT